jgi:hypothetical protein
LLGCREYGSIATVTFSYLALAVVWIGLGVLWLRRAVVGTKAPLLMTLFRSKGQPESSRVRFGHAVLGIANILLGMSYLLVLLLKTRHLH